MCGFAGFTGYLENGKDVLTDMMNKIIHRGPDSAGQYIDDKAYMGFRRLSIIDLDNGSQPMFNENKKIVITFNGEIYNYQDLRKDLIEKGHIFANNSDTEVLIHAYEEYGEDMLNKLRGMFAFVIWDSEKETLFGARDFFGIKPFYYTVVDGNIIYGSEIKSILAHPAYKKEVNDVALENYLTFQYSVLPETFFKGVYKLMPGHCFTFHNGEINIKRYWEPTFEADESKSLDEFVKEIDDAMHDSVEHHKISDVEVGSFLSSGVDSSYVAATFNGDKTFTVGFDYEKYNEIDYAKALSEKIQIDNYSKLVSSEEYWAAIPKIQYHMDEPLADPAAIALYFVSQTASKYVKVSMSGEGADEFFGGYNIYKEPLDTAGYRKLPKGLRKCLANAAQAVPFKFKGKNFFFALVLLQIIVPVQIILIPQFSQFRYFDIFGLHKLIRGETINLRGSILPYYLMSAGCMGLKNGLYIFMIRQFFRNIPKELEEAAYVDGCGTLRTFVSIMLPDAKPILTSCFLFSFVWQWTDGFYSKMFLGNIKLLSTQLAVIADRMDAWMVNTMKVPGGASVGYTNCIVSTGTLMVIIPLLILYLFAQKGFVESLSSSGIKM